MLATNTKPEPPIDTASTKVEASEAPATSSAPAPTTTAEADDDLDDLDDLLDDFADDVLNKPPGAGVASSVTGGSVAGTAAGDTEAPSGSPLNPLANELNEANIEDLIKDLKIDDPETKKQFEELVKQFDTTHKPTALEAAANPQQFDNVMKETMERLKKSGKNIDEQIKNDQSSANPEDMLTQLLAGLGGEGGDLDMSKLLVDMLEQLSSKEVLYEPIKDLNTKFPEYLTENKGTIPEADHANYTKQYELTTEILAVFEAPGYDDEDKAKREKVNVLLESLQELGQPPSDLVGDAGDFPGFGGAGAGGLPGMDFNDKDIPKDLEKELEDGCKQT